MSEILEQFVLQMLQDPQEHKAHEWIKYQRYLSEYERLYGKTSIVQPLDFQEFRAWLIELRLSPNAIHMPLNRDVNQKDGRNL